MTQINLDQIKGLNEDKDLSETIKKLLNKIEGLEKKVSELKENKKDSDSSRGSY
jgi:hypothetical protein